MQCNTMQSNRRQYNTCNTKKYHVIPYLSRLKPQLGRWGLFSQAGWFHMGCNSAGWAGFSVVMLWTPHKAIFRTQKISHKNGAMEIWDISHLGQNGPFLGPRGPRRDPIPGQSKWLHNHVTFVQPITEWLCNLRGAQKHLKKRYLPLFADTPQVSPALRNRWHNFLLLTQILNR